MERVTHVKHQTFIRILECRLTLTLISFVCTYKLVKWPPSGAFLLPFGGGRYKKPMPSPWQNPWQNPWQICRTDGHLSDGRTKSVGRTDTICRTDGHIQTPLKKHITLEKLFYLCSDWPPNYFITTNLARGFQKWA